MNDKIAKIKQHIIDHKREYTIAAIGVAAVVVAVVVTKKICDANNTSVEISDPQINASITDTTINGDVNAPLIDIDYNVIFEDVSPRANPVKRLSDGKVWSSQQLAAVEGKGSPVHMSKHLNGKLPHFHGEQYATISYEEYLDASR